MISKTEFIECAITKFTMFGSKRVTLDKLSDGLVISKTSLKQSLEYQKELEDTFNTGITSAFDLLEARALAQQARDAFNFEIE